MGDIRNIAVIAHVDHGKTTLIDAMLVFCGIFHKNQASPDRVMDSNDLERERGITILAKNTSVMYGDCKINIVDTPGHADFGGEVERTLKMVDGVMLLVDAAEGTMPQTRFVLGRALELGHKIIVVINKVDRPDRRVPEVIDEVLELLLDLNATEEQLDSPILFCSGRKGTVSASPDEEGADLRPLFEAIIGYVPPPVSDIEAPFQMLVSAVDYSEYVGRIVIGKIERGTLRQNQEVVVCDYTGEHPTKKAKAVNIYEFDGLERKPAEKAWSGDIVAISGLGECTIGDTICDVGTPEPLPFAKISEPTMEVTFSVNDSPLAGREGKYVTTRNIRDRLELETQKDVSLHFKQIPGSEAFSVAGRGEMHLGILIENMRREGFELSVSPPRVLTKEEEGRVLEPVERVILDVPENAVGAIIDKLCSRNGELVQMTPYEGRMKLEMLVPSRGLFGYRSEFLTDTRGEGIMASSLDGYVPMRGVIERRSAGSLVSYEAGDAVAYGLYNAQERGQLFISPGAAVYGGMIVGVASKSEDVTVNVCKRKQLTNMRASGSDDALRLVTPRTMGLEECLEFLAEDELLEVTPKNLRLRKKILDHGLRMRAHKRDS